MNLQILGTYTISGGTRQNGDIVQLSIGNQSSWVNANFTSAATGQFYYQNSALSDNLIGEPIYFRVNSNCCGMLTTDTTIIAGDFDTVDQLTPSLNFTYTPTVLGCTDEDACNYNPDATVDDNSCVYPTDYYRDSDGDGLYDPGPILCGSVCPGETIPTYNGFNCVTLSGGLDLNPTIPTEDIVLGCTDPNADNYDSAANVDDGTCEYPPEQGCTDDGTDPNFLNRPEGYDGPACNYNSSAEIDNGTCYYETQRTCWCDSDGDQLWNFTEQTPLQCNHVIQDCPSWDPPNVICRFDPSLWDGQENPGCTDPDANNYNEDATEDDGTCDYTIFGCTDSTACNYNSDATSDNGSCTYAVLYYRDSDGDGFIDYPNISCGGVCEGIDPIPQYNGFDCQPSGTAPEVEGCTDITADNYNEGATEDNGTCIYIGCTDENAINYDVSFNQSCNEDSHPDECDDDLPYTGINCCCEYSEDQYGCTDSGATNYNPDAIIDDGSCIDPPPAISGCTYEFSPNYNEDATEDDGSCEAPDVHELREPTANAFTYAGYLQDDGRVRYNLNIRYQDGWYNGGTHPDVPVTYFYIQISYDSGNNWENAQFDISGGNVTDGTTSTGSVTSIPFFLEQGTSAQFRIKAAVTLNDGSISLSENWTFNEDIWIPTYVCTDNTDCGEDFYTPSCFYCNYERPEEQWDGEPYDGYYIYLDSAEGLCTVNDECESCGGTCNPSVCNEGGLSDIEFEELCSGCEECWCGLLGCPEDKKSSGNKCDDLCGSEPTYCTDFTICDYDNDGVTSSVDGEIGYQTCACNAGQLHPQASLYEGACEITGTCIETLPAGYPCVYPDSLAINQGYGSIPEMFAAGAYEFGTEFDVIQSPFAGEEHCEYEQHPTNPDWWQSSGLILNCTSTCLLWPAATPLLTPDTFLTQQCGSFNPMTNEICPNDYIPFQYFGTYCQLGGCASYGEGPASGGDNPYFDSQYFAAPIVGDDMGVSVGGSGAVAVAGCLPFHLCADNPSIDLTLFDNDGEQVPSDEIFEVNHVTNSIPGSITIRINTTNELDTFHRYLTKKYRVYITTAPPYDEWFTGSALDVIPTNYVDYWGVPTGYSIESGEYGTVATNPWPGTFGENDATESIPLLGLEGGNENLINLDSDNNPLLALDPLHESWVYFTVNEMFEQIDLDNQLNAWLPDGYFDLTIPLTKNLNSNGEPLPSTFDGIEYYVRVDVADGSGDGGELVYLQYGVHWTSTNQQILVKDAIVEGCTDNTTPNFGDLIPFTEQYYPIISFAGTQCAVVTDGSHDDSGPDACNSTNPNGTGFQSFASDIEVCGEPGCITPEICAAFQLGGFHENWVCQPHPNCDSEQNGPGSGGAYNGHVCTYDAEVNGACNYNPEANVDDGSCVYPLDCWDLLIPLYCPDDESYSHESNVLDLPHICPEQILGCIDETACNYDELANTDDGSCVYPVETDYLDVDGNAIICSCEESGATSYLGVECWDGTISCCPPFSDTAISCTHNCPEPPVYGCMDTNANNFDDTANTACENPAEQLNNGVECTPCHYPTEHVIIVGDLADTGALFPVQPPVVAAVFDGILANCLQGQLIEVYIQDEDIINQETLESHITNVSVTDPSGAADSLGLVVTEVPDSRTYNDVYDFGTIVLNVSNVSSENQTHDLEITFTDQYSGDYVSTITINTTNNYSLPFFASGYYIGDEETEYSEGDANHEGAIDFYPVEQYPQINSDDWDLVYLTGEYSQEEGSVKEFSVNFVWEALTYEEALALGAEGVLDYFNDTFEIQFQPSNEFNAINDLFLYNGDDDNDEQTTSPLGNFPGYWGQFGHLEVNTDPTFPYVWFTLRYKVENTITPDTDGEQYQFTIKLIDRTGCSDENVTITVNHYIVFTVDNWFLLPTMQTYNYYINQAEDLTIPLYCGSRGVDEYPNFYMIWIGRPEALSPYAWYDTDYVGGGSSAQYPPNEDYENPSWNPIVYSVKNSNGETFSESISVHQYALNVTGQDLPLNKSASDDFPDRIMELAAKELLTVWGNDSTQTIIPNTSYSDALMGVDTIDVLGEGSQDIEYFLELVFRPNDDIIFDELVIYYTCGNTEGDGTNAFLNYAEQEYGPDSLHLYEDEVETYDYMNNDWIFATDYIDRGNYGNSIYDTQTVQTGATFNYDYPIAEYDYKYFKYWSYRNTRNTRPVWWPGIATLDPHATGEGVRTPSPQFTPIRIVTNGGETTGNFGVPGVDEIKPSLDTSFDPYSGIDLPEIYDLTNNTFDNQLQKIQNTDEFFNLDVDGRPSLGCFYSEDYNLLKDDFIFELPGEEFENYEKPNFVKNGNGYGIEKEIPNGEYDGEITVYNSSNQFSSALYTLFKTYQPEGGWDYITVSGYKYDDYYSLTAPYPNLDSGVDLERYFVQECENPYEDDCFSHVGYYSYIIPCYDLPSYACSWVQGGSGYGDITLGSLAGKTYAYMPDGYIYDSQEDFGVGFDSAQQVAHPSYWPWLILSYTEVQNTYDLGAANSYLDEDIKLFYPDSDDGGGHAFSDWASWSEIVNNNNLLPCRFGLNTPRPSEALPGNPLWRTDVDNTCHSSAFGPEGEWARWVYQDEQCLTYNRCLYMKSSKNYWNTEFYNKHKVDQYVRLNQFQELFTSEEATSTLNKLSSLKVSFYMKTTEVDSSNLDNPPAVEVAIASGDSMKSGGLLEKTLKLTPAFTKMIERNVIDGDTYELSQEMNYGNNDQSHDGGGDPGGAPPTFGTYQYPFQYFEVYEEVFAFTGYNYPAGNPYSGQFAATEIINTMMNYDISIVDDPLANDYGNDDIYMGLNISKLRNPYKFYETPGENNNYINEKQIEKLYDSGIDSFPTRNGGGIVAKNSKMNEWEKFEFTFNLTLDNQDETNINLMKGLFLTINWSNLNYPNENHGTVYLDNFEVVESYDFVPDVDVRAKITANEFSQASLLEYYDKDLEPDMYQETVAPLEAQFYFYPRYEHPILFRGDVGDDKVMHSSFRDGDFYLFDVDWGDGSPKEFTFDPFQIDENTAIYHTYETSGIFEVTGYMFRIKRDPETGDSVGIISNRKFKVLINVSDGGDDDFTYFGSDGFTFVPYPNTLPMVGGVSKNSSYYRNTKRQLGFVGKQCVDLEFMLDFDSGGDNIFRSPNEHYLQYETGWESGYINPMSTYNCNFDFNSEEYSLNKLNPISQIRAKCDDGTYVTFADSNGVSMDPAPDVDFNYTGKYIYSGNQACGGVKVSTYFEIISDKLKSELALLKMDENLLEDLEVLPDFQTPRYSSKTTEDNTTLIYSGINTITDDIGKSIGDVDLTNIKYFDKPKQIWEILGFSDPGPSYWDGGTYPVVTQNSNQLFTETDIKTLDMSEYAITPEGYVDGTLEMIVDIGSQIDYYTENIEITRGGNMGSRRCNSDGVIINNSCRYVNPTYDENGNITGEEGWNEGVNKVVAYLPECVWRRDDCSLTKEGLDCNSPTHNCTLEDHTNNYYGCEDYDVLDFVGDVTPPIDVFENSRHSGCVDISESAWGYEKYDQGYDFNWVQIYRNGPTNIEEELEINIKIDSFKIIANSSNPETPQNLLIEEHPGDPSSPRYWKNIIPESYTIEDNIFPYSTSTESDDTPTARQGVGSGGYGLSNIINFTSIQPPYLCPDGKPSDICGCTDPFAINYDQNAYYDNGICLYTHTSFSGDVTRNECSNYGNDNWNGPRNCSRVLKYGEGNLPKIIENINYITDVDDENPFTIMPYDPNNLYFTVEPWVDVSWGSRYLFRQYSQPTAPQDNIPPGTWNTYGETHLPNLPEYNGDEYIQGSFKVNYDKSIFNYDGCLVPQFQTRTPFDETFITTGNDQNYDEYSFQENYATSYFCADDDDGYGIEYATAEECYSAGCVECNIYSTSASWPPYLGQFYPIESSQGVFTQPVLGGQVDYDLLYVNDGSINEESCLLVNGWMVFDGTWVHYKEGRFYSTEEREIFNDYMLETQTEFIDGIIKSCDDSSSSHTCSQIENPIQMIQTCDCAGTCAMTYKDGGEIYSGHYDVWRLFNTMDDPEPGIDMTNISIEITHNDCAPGYVPMSMLGSTFTAGPESICGCSCMPEGFKNYIDLVSDSGGNHSIGPLPYFIGDENSTYSALRPYTLLGTCGGAHRLHYPPNGLLSAFQCTNQDLEQGNANTSLDVCFKDSNWEWNQWPVTDVSSTHCQGVGDSPTEYDGSSPVYPEDLIGCYHPYSCNCNPFNGLENDGSCSFESAWVVDVNNNGIIETSELSGGTIMSCFDPSDSNNTYIVVEGTGCGDVNATNYTPNLQYPMEELCTYGACLDQNACNYQFSLNAPDGFVDIYGTENLVENNSLCTYPDLQNLVLIWCLDVDDTGFCDPGQIFEESCESPGDNYILVTTENQSEIFGCTNNSPYLGTDENYPSDIYLCGDGEDQCLASNYDPLATYNFGCEIPVQGCTDESASNYNVNAVSDNGTCEYLNDSWAPGVNEYGNSYYYPVIPKFNSKGEFNEKNYGLQTNSDGTEKIPFGGIVYDGESWTPEDFISEVTIENSNDESMKVNINYSIDSSNVLKDNSGNKNLGFVISDKKMTFDEKTSTVKKTKNFNIVKRSKNNGAF